jgi:hypothetical protein
MRRTIPLTMCLLTVVPAGCDVPAAGPATTCRHHHFAVRWVPEPAQSLDLLVVVDDAPSAVALREEFAGRLPGIVRRLMSAVDDAPSIGARPALVEDLRVAVLSPGLGGFGDSGVPCGDPNGADGCLHRVAGGSAPECAGVIPPVAAIRSGSLNDDRFETFERRLGCLVRSTADGCGPRQPLASTRRALSVQSLPDACNDGFIRHEARLAVVIVTDRDDCSLDPADPEMADPFRTDLPPVPLRCALCPERLLSPWNLVSGLSLLDAKSSPMFGMIAGVPPGASSCVGETRDTRRCLEHPEMSVVLEPTAPPSLRPACRSGAIAAEPARRLVETAAMFGSRGAAASACDPESWERMLEELLLDLMFRPPAERCLWFEMPHEAGSCRTTCTIVETMVEDWSCGETPECPPAACPPATTPREAELRPCADPGSGLACTPLKRDLGLHSAPDGSIRRRCLLRQARRARGPAGCGPPVEQGWYYEPEGRRCRKLYWGAGPSLAWPDEVRGILEPGSSVEVRCFETACDESG